MSIPRAHDDDLMDAVASLWSSICYLLGATMVGGYIAFILLLFFSSGDIEDHETMSVNNFLPSDTDDIFNDVMAPLKGFVICLSMIVLPLQSPGWWVVWRNCCKLRSLPEGVWQEAIETSSLAVLRGIARVAAIAYLSAIVGISITGGGFSIYLAILNPDFALGIENGGELFFSIIEFWKLLVAVVCVQLPGWLGLWFLRRPSPSMADDQRWQRWRKGAVIYLWGSAAIVVTVMMIDAGLFLHDHFLVADRQFEISGFSDFLFLAFLGCLFFLVIPTMYAIYTVLLVQAPGWLVMGWLEQQRWRAAGMIKQPVDRLRRLHGVAIGYLSMITAATITWWLRLEYLGNLNFRDTPHLALVLDVLFWAQIPGWMALLLWAGLWLKKRASNRPA